MNVTFKKIALASAVGVAGAGLSAVSSAQTVSTSQIGDAAIIPYFNVATTNVTGVHLINTSDNDTVAVKVRLRERVASADVLDFNVVMSPNDVWTGLIKTNEDGEVVMTSSDNTCTVPNMPASGLTAGIVADEGYVEVFAMGSVGPSGAVAQHALHDADGMPADCAAVQSNFVRNFKNGTVNTAANGVLSRSLTHGPNPVATGTSPVATNWVGAGNVVKVSWFIREPNEGWEVGGDAVHIEGFLPNDAVAAGASMSNQSSPITDVWSFADPIGFDYPNMNGGSSADTATNPYTVSAAGTQTDRGLRGRYAALAEPTVLAVTGAQNDWVYKVADGTSITTDWVVTFPGQYVMCNDARDITPGVVISPTVYDREEGTFTPVSGEDIVVSPADPDEGTPPDVLDEEVNIIRVADSDDATGSFGQIESFTRIDNRDFESGWLDLPMTGDADKTVCDITPYIGVSATKAGVRTQTPTLDNDADEYDLSETNYHQGLDGVITDNDAVVTVGYAAWKKVRADEPGANYGRAVEHTWNR